MCGKEGSWSLTHRHIEVHHITGVSHTCNICGKISSTRAGLRNHKIKIHKAFTRSYNQVSPQEETLPLTGNTLAVDLQELDEKVNSMMEATEKITIFGNSKQKVLVCKVCGKEGQRGHIKAHIETHHISGVSHPCNICGKQNKTRELLRSHIKFHKT